MKALTTARMRAVEAAWMRDSGEDELVLMERAAEGIVERALAMPPWQSLLAVCGPGNNGGDGMAVARLALCAGKKACVLLACDEARLSPAAAAQRRMAIEADVPFLCLGDLHTLSCSREDLIVDALLGTGLSRAPEGTIAAAIDWINRQEAQILSVDVPSGLDATSGRVYGSAVRADATVAAGWPKTGMLLPQGRALAGTWSVAPIGIPGDDLEPGDADVLLAPDAALLMPPRPLDGHKGTFGTVLILAGLEPYAGAAALCAMGALRGGAGLVRVVCGASALPVVRTHAPEAVCQSIDDADLAREVSSCGALCAGPGLGTGEKALDALQTALDAADAQGIPILLDADALNLTAKHGFRVPEGTVLTPHPGEMARLTGLSAVQIADELTGIACKEARARRSIVLLKGATTVIASPVRHTLNITGNPGMATGGSGDVLSGLIAALLAQGALPYDAARLGAYLHGIAGDIAARAGSMRGMTAGDIARNLGQAWLTLEQESPRKHKISQKEALKSGYATMSEINMAWADLGLETDEATFRAYEANLPEREPS